MSKKKHPQDEFIRFLEETVGQMYSNTLEHFTYKEKKKILNNPKIERPKPPVFAGIDYEESKIDELFLKKIDRYVKEFHFTTRQAKALRIGLSYDSQVLYLMIWKENEKIKLKNGKYNLSRATEDVLKKYDENLKKEDRKRYYGNIKIFNMRNSIKSLQSYRSYLISIGSKLV